MPRKKQDPGRSHADLTLIFDHDVVDGASAAGFVARLRDLLESASDP